MSSTSSATLPGDRRRCVVPKTDRLHQVHVYGQPRAVMSETGANPCRERHAAR